MRSSCQKHCTTRTLFRGRREINNLSSFFVGVNSTNRKKSSTTCAQIDELLSLIMPPPHLTARVIHGWLIIINNYPSPTYVSSQNIYVNKVIIPSNKVMFFLRQPPKSADCVNLIFQSKGSIHFNE